MMEQTFEIPSTVVIQALEPVVDDSGVTQVAVMMITTVDGSVRRFVFTTDDLRKVILLVEESLNP